MESQKYSFIHLKIEVNYSLEIIGSRKGLSPFVLDFSIRMGKDQIVSESSNLNTPYIHSNIFSSLKSNFGEGVRAFKEKLLIQENSGNKILFSMEWKPTDSLTHELIWSVIFEIEITKKSNNLTKIIGRVGQKKLKSVKKNIILSNQDNPVFDTILIEIINLIQTKIENFDTSLIQWLIE
ncbi:MAG: hypothetical protein ACW981_09215 [Candidatus Hodarchaeales archaeon]|jgi:hypothetical protein